MDNLGDMLDCAVFYGIPACFIVENWNLEVGEVRIRVDSEVVGNRREDDDCTDKKEGEDRQEYVEGPPTVHGGKNKTRGYPEN